MQADERYAQTDYICKPYTIIDMKRIIFLDFDGVLNTDNYTKRLVAEGKVYRDVYGDLFDPEAVHNLRTIIDSVPDAKIAITSTWKDTIGADSVMQLWKDRDMPGKIYGMTRPFIPDFFSMDSDFELAIMAGKGHEVRQWLEEHAEGECRYVILDDMSYFLPEQEPHHVKVDPFLGITEEDAEKAIGLLG